MLLLTGGHHSRWPRKPGGWRCEPAGDQDQAISANLDSEPSVKEDRFSRICREARSCSASPWQPPGGVCLLLSSRCLRRYQLPCVVARSQEHAIVENKAAAVTLKATDPEATRDWCGFCGASPRFGWRCAAQLCCEAAGTSFVNGTALQPGVAGRPLSRSSRERSFQTPSIRHVAAVPSFPLPRRSRGLWTAPRQQETLNP